MKKKEYIAPISRTVHLEAKYTLLQMSQEEPQRYSLRYSGDDYGEGEGD